MGVRRYELSDAQWDSVFGLAQAAVERSARALAERALLARFAFVADPETLRQRAPELVADVRAGRFSFADRSAAKMTSCVRTASAKLIRYPGHEEWTELFDLKADPYETKNLAKDPGRKDLLEAMLAEYDRQAKAAAGAQYVLVPAGAGIGYAERAGGSLYMGQAISAKAAQKPKTARAAVRGRDLLERRLPGIPDEATVAGAAFSTTVSPSAAVAAMSSLFFNMRVPLVYRSPDGVRRRETCPCFETFGLDRKPLSCAR